MRLLEKYATFIGISLTILVFSSPIILPSTLAYSGRCGWHYMPHDELIKAVATQLNSREDIRIPPSNDRFKRKPYDDVEQFLSLNADCCKFNEGTGYDIPPATFWEKIAGKATYKLKAQFNVNYVTNENEVKSVLVAEDNYVSNCGEIVLSPAERIISINAK